MINLSSWPCSWECYWFSVILDLLQSIVESSSDFISWICLSGGFKLLEHTALTTISYHMWVFARKEKLLERWQINEHMILIGVCDPRCLEKVFSNNIGGVVWSFGCTVGVFAWLVLRKHVITVYTSLSVWYCTHKTVVTWQSDCIWCLSIVLLLSWVAWVSQMSSVQMP